MAKVSILVPIFNVEKYLKECLDSLLSQTLADIELILINDGSKDNSLEIMKEYQRNDARIKIIDKKNTGYGSSMNQGLDLACGEYIGIVEPDDFVKKTMFEDLYNLAIKNDAQMVKSDYFYYYSSNKQARRAGKILKQATNKIICAKQYPKLLKMQPSIWSAIYKNEFLKSKNIRFLETPGASFQDTSFAFKVAAMAERIVLSDKAYLYYRQDNENSSVHSKNKVFLICQEFDEITKFLDENPEIKKFANTQKLIKQYSAYIWNLKRIDAEFRDSFIDVFSETFKKYYENKEIKPLFYLKYSKRQLKMLINDKTKFRKFIDKVVEKEKNKIKRRTVFSIRINSSRISIVLFGKQILEIG